MSKTIIAGPCSVESRDQLLSITRSLSRIPQVSLIRAGVWKPRTRPGAFEGLGEVALSWMQELASEYHVNYCCEVARPEHIDLCLQHGINTVWIGARTTTNPFMVDELCSALRGTNMAVLVKNPVCPDTQLWLGAIERLEAASIHNITAIHRGFNLYNNRGYRNAPMWEAALELRRQRPDLPVLCDPSHMGGRRDLVTPLSLIALQLDYDGLMVEVHPSPDQAWSDAAQQLTPLQFASLLDILPPAHNAHPDYPALLPLREQIDTIDHELLNLLAKRMAVSRRIADVKRQANIPVYQPRRWQAVIADRLSQAGKLGLDTSFTKQLLDKIHTESVRIQLQPPTPLTPNPTNPT